MSRRVPWGLAEALLLVLGVPLSALLCVALVVLAALAGSTGVHAAILAEVDPDDSPTVCNADVPGGGEWDYRGSGDGTNAQFTVMCDTPVPGAAKYYRVDTVNLQHDAWNIHDFPSALSLTVGQTYYFGGFFRFDTIAGADIWHDGVAPNSYDKLFEFFGGGSFRVLITAGWHDYYNNGIDGKYTYGAYLSPTACPTSPPCMYDDVDANVPPYGRSNPYPADYGRWYAVVYSVKVSNGISADGLLELYINGTKIYSQVSATQNNTAPSVTGFQYSGTIAQGSPGYDAPAHYRKLGRVLAATTLADMQAAGLMEDPEASGSSPALSGHAAAAATAAGRAHVPLQRPTLNRIPR